jgi:hypothetical protein
MVVLTAAYRSLIALLWARIVTPRVRRCGTCGKTGYNTKTCQDGIKASGNEYNN